ncbi:hypothetical protein BpHYR1_000899, partial [Brachionus plicatilis]
MKLLTYFAIIIGLVKFANQVPITTTTRPSNRPPLTTRPSSSTVTSDSNTPPLTTRTSSSTVTSDSNTPPLTTRPSSSTVT